MASRLHAVPHGRGSACTGVLLTKLVITVLRCPGGATSRLHALAFRLALTKHHSAARAYRCPIASRLLSIGQVDGVRWSYL
jgi:hypothetical protein